MLTCLVTVFSAFFQGFAFFLPSDPVSRVLLNKFLLDMDVPLKNSVPTLFTEELITQGLNSRTVQKLSAIEVSGFSFIC